MRQLFDLQSDRDRLIQISRQLTDGPLDRGVRRSRFRVGKRRIEIDPAAIDIGLDPDVGIHLRQHLVARWPCDRRQTIAERGPYHLVISSRAVVHTLPESRAVGIAHQVEMTLAVFNLAVSHPVPFVRHRAQ